jgi:protein subunit release factor A
VIESKDLKIEITPRAGRGGQHVYPEPTNVTVTHIPTGVSATVCQRSQATAREIAVDMITAAITHPRWR